MKGVGVMKKKEASLSDIAKITDESLRVSAIYDIFHEEERLNRSNSARIEFLTTIHYIEEVLKPGDKILDLGAGTGVYSLYFASQGYSVTAVELADRNVEIFRSMVTEEMDIRLLHGNALDLSVLNDKEFDIVLLFGPLYHLEKAEDRKTCLLEARRVLKDSGTIYVSFINHDMIPFTESLYDPLWFKGSSYNHETFRLQNFPFIFFNIDECREMLVEGGFVLEKEIASDGFSELLADTINQMDEEAYKQYLRYHMLICEKKEFLGASNHFLFKARKNIHLHHIRSRS